MTAALEAQLLKQLEKLPPNRIAEVVNFAAFLAEREEREAAGRRLGDSMAKLHAVDLPPLSEDEIEEAVQESRRARRQANEQAGDQPPPFSAAASKQDR
jgi:Protein of unknown function (DUF2281).